MKIPNEILQQLKKLWLEHNNTAFTIDSQGNISYNPGALSYTAWNKFSEAEINGRLKFIEAWYGNGCITIMPLYSPYDLFLYSPLDYGCIEIKERDKVYTEVILEQKKWSEAVSGGYSDYFFYTNIFNTGDIYSWYPKDLELNPSVIYCPKSSMGNTTKVPKDVYLLPLESRRKDLDLRIS